MSRIYNHNDKVVVDYLENNPYVPYFISYPRTGSHWIRYVMEKYFKKPSLVVIYEYVNSKEFTSYHTHDFNGDDDTSVGDIKKENVIYLYRDPVDTIYSMIKYKNMVLSNEETIKINVECYRNHLTKWLIDDNFTKNKLIIKYENFKNNFSLEFKKICDYYKVDFDSSKLNDIIEGLDKTKIKKESTNQYSKIDNTRTYDIDRSNFKENYTDLINDIMFNNNLQLKKFFN
jgi:hypothetical protein